jgi:hypothetical protein
MYTKIRDQHLSNAMNLYKYRIIDYALFLWRLLERIDVLTNDRFLLASSIVTRGVLDERIFPTSSNNIGSRLIWIVNFGRTRRCDNWFESSWLFILFSLSAIDDSELTVDVLDWRLEWIVGRQIRKLGLAECFVVVNDDDEYWDTVRWRSSQYACGEDNGEVDGEVDNVGESRRDERDLNIIFWKTK